METNDLSPQPWNFMRTVLLAWECVPYVYAGAAIGVGFWLLVR